MSELKDKLQELLKHPVLRLAVRPAIEKALKRAAQAVVAWVIVLAVQGNPTLDTVGASTALLGVVMGLLEAGRTTLKVKLQGRYPAIAALL